MIWFRGHDLRLSDQAAVAAAARADEMVAVVAVPEEADRPFHHQFLLESIEDLAARIREAGNVLLVSFGDPAETIRDLAARHEIERVHALRGTRPRDLAVEERLGRLLHCPLTLHDGHLLRAPGTLRTQSGEPYSVFTPFRRTFLEQTRVDRPTARPRRLPPAPAQLPPMPVPAVPDPPGAVQAGGVTAASRRLRRFRRRVARYAERRDLPGVEGTSRISADLKFGTLSPRQAWWAAGDEDDAGAQAFRSELVWREFNASTLWDRPDLLERPFREAWTGFPWRESETAWTAWREGRTGVPFVDASARQLLAEGFVHNRARMVSASFLTKQLLVDYTLGEAHYFEYLVDGDEAQNNAGWQWATGCGCDAQPWFRIFNPVLQGRRFDPEGAYVRTWLPELERMPARWIHEPWNAPAGILAEAGVRIGTDWPAPVVDLQAARERFLDRARSHLS